MMDFRIKYVIFIFLLIFTISACNTPESDSPEGWQTYENPELGIRFELPNTWVIQETADVITIAVNQEMLDNGIADGAGASITLASAEDFDGLNEPSDILGFFMEYFEAGRPDLNQTSEPTFFTIQGQPAATVQYNGTVREQNGIFTITIVTNEDQIALTLAVNGGQDEQYQQVLDRITQSIHLLKPTR